MTMNRNFILFFCIIFFCGSCSFTEVLQQLNVVTDRWSPSDPLTLYGYPFHPKNIEDPESYIGVIAWVGLKVGVDEYSEYTKGKVRWVGIAEGEREVHSRVLESIEFYGKQKKSKETQRQILEDECKKQNAEALLYGLYATEETEMRLTVYMFVCEDKLALSERGQISVNNTIVEKIVYNIENDLSLTKSQEEFLQTLTTKVATLTKQLIEKYINGK